MQFLKRGTQVKANDKTSHVIDNGGKNEDLGVIIREKDPFKDSQGNTEIAYVVEWKDGDISVEHSCNLQDTQTMAEKVYPVQDTEAKLEVDPKEAVKLLKEWQKNLMLEDWVIKLRLLSDEEADKEHPEFTGWNDVQATLKCSHITVRKVTTKEDFILKQPFEQVLIHELLHCKFGLDDIDDSFVGEYNHQQLEDLSRSLFMAKYGLTLDYFKNF